MNYPYVYEKYVLDDIENIKEQLTTHGVAIIPNILNDSECSSMRDGMWADVEHITQNFETPIKREDDTSWKSWWDLYPKHAMLIQNYQLGQTQTVWDVRQNPKVVQTFSNLWNTPVRDMLCSFDGISFHIPPEKTNRGWFKNNWLHTDQSFTRPEFECVQGWITGEDVREGDATLTFLKNSHLFHKDVSEEFNITNKADWTKITPEIHEYYAAKGCSQECIKCPKGSIVLWDSRLIHCGKEPDRGRENQTTRYVVYVCMTPRSLATPANLRKKLKAMDELRMTTHWPHKPKLFPVNPRTYGGELPKVTSIEKPVLSELGKRLAGYE
jgi:hypothetical protein